MLDLFVSEQGDNDDIDYTHAWVDQETRPLLELLLF